MRELKVAVYRPVVSVDFVKLKIYAFGVSGDMRTGTNFQTIKRLLNVDHVEALNADKHGGSATEFIVTIQDPEHFDFTAWVLERVPTAHSVELVAIEISLDFFPVDLRAADLPGLAAHLSQMLKEKVSDRTRFIRRAPTSTGSRKVVVNGIGHSSLIKTIEDRFRCDSTYYVGDKKDLMTQRIYVKTKDAGLALPADQHRCRLELTLKGEEIRAQGIVNDQGEFRLEKVARYFRLNKVSAKRAGVLQAIHDRFSQLSEIGARVPVRTEGRKIRNFRRGVEADKPANQAIYNALRNCSRKINRNIAATNKASRKSIDRCAIKAAIECSDPPVNTDSNGRTLKTVTTNRITSVKVGRFRRQIPSVQPSGSSIRAEVSRQSEQNGDQRIANINGPPTWTDAKLTMSIWHPPISRYSPVRSGWLKRTASTSTGSYRATGRDQPTPTGFRAPTNQAHLQFCARVVNRFEPLHDQTRQECAKDFLGDQILFGWPVPTRTKTTLTRAVSKPYRHSAQHRLPGANRKQQKSLFTRYC